MDMIICIYMTDEYYICACVLMYYYYFVLSLTLHHLKWNKEVEPNMFTRLFHDRRFQTNL